MGKGFGNLDYIRGQVSYKISPFEQRAFAGFWSSWGRVFYRMRTSAVKVVPPFILSYLVYTEAEKNFIKINRKNPEDYANDK